MTEHPYRFQDIEEDAPSAYREAEWCEEHREGDNGTDLDLDRARCDACIRAVSLFRGGEPR